ncbi:MAG: hypothetical protein ACRDR6_03525 [Pseudonocardiaceae bacterium]
MVNPARVDAGGVWGGIGRTVHVAPPPNRTDTSGVVVTFSVTTLAAAQVGDGGTRGRDAARGVPAPPDRPAVHPTLRTTEHTQGGGA